jgi:hypothetical protein
MFWIGAASVAPVLPGLMMAGAASYGVTTFSCGRVTAGAGEPRKARTLLRRCFAQAYLEERIKSPPKSSRLGTKGKGKNTIARLSKLQPPASRPKVRALSAIIY